ncbi:squalene synthase HpnC [Comamonas sp. CMM02]|uniref:squalene synthase HpnC n=1 Tax=Comamonas sp. CMM02 TaxID=2769307 RepID=UPI00351C495A
MNAPDPTRTQASPVTHYENFPVASWLCPAHLRQPVAAIYAFARAADDIADEGTATAAQRLAELQSYRAQLHAIAQGQAPQPRWMAIFGPLQLNIQLHQLPVALLDDLLSAFIQDIEKTRDAATYADRAELLDYCRRSANPVGRLLLHLYGVHNEQALQQSDAICTALQLINFWQDLSEDIPRGRHYLTDADCAQHGVSRHELALLEVTPGIEKLIASNVLWARQSMQNGLSLVHGLPGRIGWELRLVVQGGLCILDKVQAQRGHNLHARRTLRKTDMPRMLWRALWM